MTWGHFHGSPLKIYVNVLERKIWSKLPYSVKEGNVKARQTFLSNVTVQKSVLRSIFDLVVTNRYVASEWILKTMHLAFHFELLGETETTSTALHVDEWGYFLQRFLRDCLSSEGINRRVDLSLTSSGK